MELLEQLEARVVGLLTRQKNLMAEIAHLRAEAGAMLSTRAALEEENRKLRESLQQQDALHEQVLARIDGLLQKIQEYDSIE